MKKLSIISLLLITLGITQAQHFEQYFVSKTLRIDYLHRGNLKVDTILFAQAHSYDTWAGTTTQLIDPFMYGANRVELYDSTSGVLIYSRGYSNLFEEWRTTGEGKVKTETFEETLLVPMPKKTTKLVVKRRERNCTYSEITHFYLNPRKIKTSAVKKSPIMLLHEGGDSNECIDITFIADGYRTDDSIKLKKDFNRYAKYLLNCKPFNTLKKSMNIVGVLSYSKDSGITDPIHSIVKNTAVGCTFNSIGSDRYLMTTNMWSLHNYIESISTDAIVIICNTDKYGGGGIYNYYATVAAGSESGDFILIHEMGHSVAGLGDEYYSSEVSVEDFYPLTVEPWEPNITTLVAFDKKWKIMISKDTPIPTPCIKEYQNTIGVFEGAGYMTKGIYRPWQNCSMKEVKYDAFCPVCISAISKMIGYYRD